MSLMCSCKTCETQLKRAVEAMDDAETAAGYALTGDLPLAERIAYLGRVAGSYQHLMAKVIAADNLQPVDRRTPGMPEMMNADITGMHVTAPLDDDDYGR